MSDAGDLPTTRSSLTGLDGDGNEVWLIRSISQKLYRCPGCHQAIEPGDVHVVVQVVHRAGGTRHTHWHERCASAGVTPTLRGVRSVNAKESKRERLEQRGRQKPKHRRRPRRGR